MIRVSTGISLFFLLLLVCAFGRCSSDAARFQNQAINFASDNRIDEAEYKKLQESIQQSKDGSLKSLIESDGSIGDAKVHSYLLKLFVAKKLSVSADDIWTQKPPVPAGFNVDVFIENSASMDGYVKGLTEFETAIYNLLGDLKVSGLAKTLNLSYINKTITYSRPNALQPDIQDFIEKLEPSTFAQRGGDRGTSDLQNILKTMLEKLDGNNVVILVSDFVFSPGKRKDAKDYLNNQSVGIKIEFAEKLKNYDLSLAVIQLQSGFDGAYYDKFNSPRNLSCERPYYIWIFGTSAQIKELIDRKLIDTIKGGFLNRLTFAPAREPIPMEYKILARPRTGTFELRDGTNGPITAAKAANGIFEFSVAVSFPGSMEDKNYFLDANNYVLSDPRYKLTIQPVNGADQNLTGFSHRLVFQTSDPQDESLDVAVVGRIPSWVESSTSLDDTGISCTNDEIHKTFGFRYLIDGVNDAFFPQSTQKEIYKTRVVIKR